MRASGAASRACYVHFDVHGIIFLVILYAKNQKDNISPGEAEAIAKLIAEVRDDLNRSKDP